LDKIFFSGMSFYGFHGVYGAEAELGQRFMVDLELTIDLSRAGASDDLHDTVNYAEVFTCVQKVVEGERYNLVERLTTEVAQQLLTQFPLVEVKVKVTKPNPPIKGHYEGVAIEMIRKREDFAL